MTPISVRRLGAGIEKEVVATTRDISEGGVFVLTSSTFDIGDEVWVEVRLPRVRNAGLMGLRLSSLGKVIRLAASGEQGGFAVQATFTLPRGR